MTCTRPSDVQCTTFTCRGGSITSHPISSTSSAPRTLLPTQPESCGRWRRFSACGTGWRRTSSTSTQAAASTVCASISDGVTLTRTESQPSTESACHPAKVERTRRLTRTCWGSWKTSFGHIMNDFTRWWASTLGGSESLKVNSVLEVLSPGFPRLLESPGFFSSKFHDLESPRKSLWSWKVLEIKA